MLTAEPRGRLKDKSGECHAAARRRFPYSEPAFHRGQYRYSARPVTHTTGRHPHTWES